VLDKIKKCYSVVPDAYFFFFSRYFRKMGECSQWPGWGGYTGEKKGCKEIHIKSEKLDKKT
jgi:hypothetical protein